MAPAHKKAKTSAASAAAPAVAKNLGGDDLDDNFLLDDEFAAGSDIDDPELAGTGDAVLSDDAGAALDSDQEDDGRPATKKQKQQQPGKKRAAVEEAGELGDRPISKRAAKKANRRKREPATGADDEEKKQDDMGLLPTEALADRLAEKQKKALPNLSALELDEQRITQSMITDTSSVTDRESLLAFLKAALPTQCNTLAKMPKATGSPRIIVVAGAALRVADLCREVKSFKTKTKDGLIDVGKLFAKHFKLAEHVEYLAKTHVGLAVGTPNRIEKLLNETEALHLTHLSHLILDVSHLDSKKRSLVDLPEARADLFKLLGSKPIMDRLRDGKMKLVIF